jgi:hypothetical protein
MMDERTTEAHPAWAPDEGQSIAGSNAGPPWTAAAAPAWGQNAVPALAMDSYRADRHHS